MALYDLSNDLQRVSFLAKAKALAKKGTVAELTEKKAQRSSSQNRYLHAVCGYVGAQLGETVANVKHDYFKLAANAELFVRDVPNPITGIQRRALRSSAELNTAEMTLAIERFRNWAAQVLELYIPSPDEYRLVLQMEIEAQHARRYL